MLLITLVWVTTSFSYYMINLKVKYFPGDFNLNVVMLNLSDMFAYSIGGCLLRCARAKVIFSICFVTSAIAGTGIIVVSQRSDEVGWAFVMLVIMSRLGIAANFNVVYIAQAKMFPTLFSVTAMGIANFCARVSIALAPMIAEIHQPIPMSIFVTLTIITAITSLFIDEPKEAEKKSL